MTNQIHFLCARFAEDEELISATPALYDPARSRREVEAKRRMLASLLPNVQRLASAVENEHGEYEGAPDVLLGLLALPYSDHPDYDEAWRP